jgi:hypothetical protein
VCKAFLCRVAVLLLLLIPGPLLSVGCMLAAATAQSVTLAAPLPLPSGSLYYEVVEARIRKGLHFRGGGQTLCFGDSPQVHSSYVAGACTDAGAMCYLVSFAGHIFSKDVKSNSAIMHRTAICMYGTRLALAKQEAPGGLSCTSAGCMV